MGRLNEIQKELHFSYGNNDLKLTIEDDGIYFYTNGEKIILNGDIQRSSEKPFEDNSLIIKHDLDETNKKVDENTHKIQEANEKIDLTNEKLNKHIGVTNRQISHLKTLVDTTYEKCKENSKKIAISFRALTDLKILVDEAYELSKGIDIAKRAYDALINQYKILINEIKNPKSKTQKTKCIKTFGEELEIKKIMIELDKEKEKMLGRPLNPHETTSRREAIEVILHNRGLSCMEINELFAKHGNCLSPNDIIFTDKSSWSDCF